jgi:processive 1,2-diacylglycerol beta-glucosyltransferase
MGGSQGLGAMEHITRSFLADTRHGYQIIIVTGSNKKLFSRLNRLNRGKGAGRMKVLSFVDNADELMEISDIVVSKAGGMTTAEALVKGLPMLIVDPIPGHERRNADFLVANGAAVEIGDLGKVYDKVNELFDSRDMLQAMKESARKLSKPDSALDVAKLALEEGS